MSLISSNLFLFFVFLILYILNMCTLYNTSANINTGNKLLGSLDFRFLYVIIFVHHISAPLLLYFNHSPLQPESHATWNLVLIGLYICMCTYVLCKNVHCSQYLYNVHVKCRYIRFTYSSSQTNTCNTKNRADK